MTARSTTHATFVIERNLDFSPKFVFRAWADPKAKARWLAGPQEWSREKYGLDFRVGGHEYQSGGPSDGPTHHYNATYQDIVQDERIIYVFDMHLDDKRITVSLATVEFKPAGAGTRMIFTEQIVFLDGFDHLPERKEGTEAMLDNLEAELKRSAEA
jgi:uncharacterized protein YndB with AHSA1/START domain